jgi:N-acyl-D-amino-acid deacylase
MKKGTSGTQGIAVDWSAVVIASANEPHNEALIGATIEAAAARRGVDPFDLYFDLLVEERLGSGCLLHIGDEENVRAIMQHRVHMAGSDGLLFGQHPHPRGYGTFPRYLGHYSRDLRVVELEEMVRKMTSLPARRLGLTDRGLLHPGYAADIVCFDPDRVRDTATYEAPRRLPEGIPHVFVNGEQVVADGRHTGALPGRALRRRARG